MSVKYVAIYVRKPIWFFYLNFFKKIFKTVEVRSEESPMKPDILKFSEV